MMLEPQLSPLLDAVCHDERNKKNSIQGSDNYNSGEQLRCKLERRLSSYGLISRHHIPSHCREPHIEHGYRPYPSNFTYCIKSIFYPTNETLNIWTHGFPCLLMILHYIKFAESHLHDFFDPVLCPFWLFAAGIVLMLLVSTCAHTFNCLSLGAREVCFCCDYGAIAIHAITLLCSITCYICAYSCDFTSSDVSSILYVIMMIGNILCAVTACVTRYPNIPHRSCIRVFPYVLMCTMMYVPCIYKYSNLSSITVNKTLEAQVASGIKSASCRMTSSSQSAYYFVVFSVTLVLGALVQAYKMPERWWPGKFDIVGHSHQIFHILTAVGLYYESLLVELAVVEIVGKQQYGNLGEKDLHMTWFSTLFTPSVTILVSCAAALYFSIDLYKFRMKHKIQ